MTANAQLAAHYYNASAEASIGRASATLEAYRAMNRFIARDHAELMAAIKVEASASDPYAGLEELSRDIRDNGRMRVFSGSLGHPVLSDAENLIFRAVHDYFAHFLPQIGFASFDDERRAFFAHAARWTGPYSRAARRVMGMEVIGQAGHFYTFGHFPAQRTGLFPYEVFA